MKKNALGRGLDALLPRIEQESQVRDIPLDDIDINQNQPRKAFDDQSLQELAQSIQEVGLLQPILVTEHRNRYRIVAGERRFRAARLAGLDSVPCIVRTFTANEQLEAALVENLQREDLNAIEEAAAYQQLSNQFGLDAEAIAARVGKSRPAVANTLRLLQLPPEIQALVRERRLSAGHARALLALDDDAARTQLAQRAIDDHLSVRALEAAVKEQQAGPAKPPRSKAPRRERSASVLEVEERLSERFATRVDVQVGAKDRGKIVIEFSGLDDLSRLFDALTAGDVPGDA